MPSSNPLRCAYYMPRKKRQCNLSSIPPAKFCTVHTPSYASAGVPCPYCSTILKKHSIDSHVRVCPKAIEVAKSTALPSFVRDINLLAPMQPLSTLPMDTSEAAVIAARSHAKLASFDLWRPRRDVPQETSSVRVRWGNARESSVRFEGTYFAQSAALTALILDPPSRGIMTTPQRIGVVELGAGRAYTALFMAEVLQMRGMAIDVVVVDRDNPRLGADRSLRAFKDENTGAGDMFSFSRLKCDLKDLYLPAVDTLQRSDHLLVIGKHVCGAALDMALLCISRFARETGVPVKFALASCCRHRCAWQATPASRAIWDEQWEISETSFGHLCRMSGWCLGCTDNEDAIRTGSYCQELVDAARVLWLRQQGWNAHLVRYVDAEVSPENIAIVATWLSKGMGKR